MESTVSPEEADQESGAGSGGCLNDKEDLTHSFETVLKDLPEVLLYIKRLNEHIKKQQSTLVRLFEKLKEYVSIKFLMDIRCLCKGYAPFLMNFINGF